MRTLSWAVLLVGAFALATALFGWWTVPVLAAAGALWNPNPRRAAFASAGAAALAWALLLLWTARAGRVGNLAGKLGASFGVPALAVVALTLVFPALLAGSATSLALALRGARHRAPAERGSLARR